MSENYNIRPIIISKSSNLIFVLIFRMIELRRMSRAVQKDMRRIVRRISTTNCFPNKSLRSCDQADRSKIRNIGILAHIDAGKYFFLLLHIVEKNKNLVLLLLLLKIKW